MAKRQSKKVIASDTASSEISVTIPDEAIDFIAHKYVSTKNVDGVPIIITISTEDIETILGLFVEWAASKNYVKDGVLFIGGNPVG